MWDEHSTLAEKSARHASAHRTLLSTQHLYGRQAFLNPGPTVWNSLPYVLRDRNVAITAINSFLRQYFSVYTSVTSALEVFRNWTGCVNRRLTYLVYWEKNVAVQLTGGCVAMTPLNVTLCQVAISAQLALNDDRVEYAAWMSWDARLNTLSSAQNNTKCRAKIYTRSVIKFYRNTFTDVRRDWLRLCLL